MYIVLVWGYVGMVDGPGVVHYKATQCVDIACQEECVSWGYTT